MKHKTAELEGVLLDAAVAKAEGCALTEYDDTGGPISFQPSALWEHAGPIIERERIAAWKADGDWCAAVPGDSAYPGDCDYIDVTRRDGSSGPTPLIAAMRAYVASKFGEEVEL